MTRKWLFPMVLDLVAVSALLLSGCSQPVHPAAGKMAEWGRFNYQKVGGPTPKDFNVRFTAAGVKKETAPCGRLAINVQDPANYHFIEFRDSGIDIGRVENGIEVHTGSRSRTGIGTGEPHKIVVKRRNASIVVIVDETVVAEACDDAFTGGDVLLGAVGGSVAYEKPAIQKVDKPYFADDFMKAEGEMGDWQTVAGSWEISHIDNPSLSSNAFCLEKKQGSNEGIIVVSPFDHWFWDNYSYRVAVRPLGDEPVGVFFYYRDKDNYFLLKWGAEGSDLAKTQLIKKYRGKETVLAEEKGGYAKNQWYAIDTQVFDTHVEVSIDGSLVFRVDDPNLCFGTIGLYCGGGPAGAHFDDVLVKTSQAYEDDFTEYSAGKWTELGGAWKLIAETGGRRSFAVNTEKGPAKAISGGPDWRNYVYTTRVGPWAAGTAGVCFHYQDEQNYYCFKWRKDPQPERLLVKVHNGKETVLCSDTPPKGGSGRYQVATSVDDGHILVCVDGEPVFETWDADIACGRIGLYASDTPSALFGEVSVRFIREKSAMPTLHEAFSRESTMADWASIGSDWEEARNDVVGSDVAQTNWCRADFPGNVDIELRYVPKLEPGAQVRLLLSGDGKDFLSGYSLVVSAGKGENCTILRQNDVVAKASMDVSKDLYNLRFRRSGRYVAGLAGPRAIVEYRDERPLQGQKAGFSTVKVNVKKSDFEVLCNHVYNYLFRESNFDWRVASGIWEVTNRWQCDPRWSFFSGRSNKLAAIWNKREMKGDITVEFFAGPKMDQDRGRKYEYASDMNVTLCADGKDLTSGYSFLFGGWHNTRTQIWKGDKKLAEKFFRIPIEMNVHRRWFYLKAERKGNHLAFYVDDELVLECDDPEPLDAGHVAIWTFNNGIMVSRVRISNAEGDTKDSPFAQYPVDCKCIYDLRT